MFENDIPSDSEDERLDGDDTDNELDPNFEPAVPNTDDETSTTSNEDDDYGQSPDHSYVEECDDDLNDPTQSQPSKRQRTTVDGAPRTFHWVKKDLPAHVNPENDLIPRGKAADATTIMEMFLAHFDNDAFELLTLESNRFMDQCGRTRCTKIHVQELKTFVGICMYMSIVSLPSRRMYWSPGTRQAIVANAMTVNRFEDIMSLFHCNDNTLMKGKGEVGYDRLHKVRPLINIINQSFIANAEPEAFVAIDEQMVPFKGRHGLKCYMMKKPKKWGYKVWVHAGRSGFVHCLQFAGDNSKACRKCVSSCRETG